MKLSSHSETDLLCPSFRYHKNPHAANGAYEEPMYLSGLGELGKESPGAAWGRAFPQRGGSPIVWIELKLGFAQDYGATRVYNWFGNGKFSAIELDCGTSPELYAVSDTQFDGLAR